MGRSVAAAGSSVSVVPAQFHEMVLLTEGRLLMRWTWRGFVAAVLVGAVWVPYVGYLWQGGMPLVPDGRGMAAVGLLLGLAAWLVAGWSGGWLAATLGSLSLGCGIGALITRNETALAVFVLSLAAAIAVAGVARGGADPQSG